VTKAPRPGDSPLSPNALRRSLLVLIGVAAGTCVLWALLRRDDLLGLTGCIGLIGLAIWVLIALQRWITGPGRRMRADGSNDAHQKRPWQFSLRSLFVVTLVFAGLCSFLKVVPAPVFMVIVFVLYIAVVCTTLLIAIGFVISVINVLVVWIERRLSGVTEMSTLPDADDHRDESGSTTP
jgi:hypothetical protein